MTMAETDTMQLRGIMKQHEPMSRHTSWRVGGCADRFYQPADVADLQQLLKQLPDEEPVFWLGLGSNLLVRDGGIRGTVICRPLYAKEPRAGTRVCRGNRVNW